MKTVLQRKKLCEICINLLDGDWIERKDQSSEGIRLIQTGNIGNGIFKDRAEKSRYITEDTFNRLRCNEIVPGDCLISRLPDPVGRACLIPYSRMKMITAVDCAIVRFQKKSIIPSWFIYYTLSREYQIQVTQHISGATRQRISRKNLGLIEIPLPNISEQQRIVTILDKAFATIAKAIVNAEKNQKSSRCIFEIYLKNIFSNFNDEWKPYSLAEITSKIGSGATPLGGKKSYKHKGLFIL